MIPKLEIWKQETRKNNAAAMQEQSPLRSPVRNY